MQEKRTSYQIVQRPKGREKWAGGYYSKNERLGVGFSRKGRMKKKCCGRRCVLAGTEPRSRDVGKRLNEVR